jgi:hypothetical protein
MNDPVGSYGALSTSLHGVMSGLQQFAKAADEVQRAASHFGDADHVTLSPEAQALIAARRQMKAGIDGAANDERSSLERGLVDMRLARFAVLANLAAMQTTNEMLDVAVRIAEAAHRYDLV